MTENTAQTPYLRRRPSRHTPRENGIDPDVLWKSLGQSSPPQISFYKDVIEALQIYDNRLRRLVSLPAQQRSRLYAKLENAVEALSTQLADLHEVLELEIADAGCCLEPEDFEETLPPDYEGLSYGEFKIEQLWGVLNEFSEIQKTAFDIHKKPRGQPKRNETLEEAVKNLGFVFQKYTGEDPLGTYRFDPLDEDRPYRSRFFDFLHSALWAWNGEEQPTGQAIGDVARRVFARRK